jgi:hypothetical protein
MVSEVATMKAITASRRVERALAAGILIRPDHCEVCNRSESAIREYIAQRRGSCKQSRSVIGAHHHAGYEDPLNVWWVCTECNGMLWDRHDSSLTLAQAQELYHLRHLEAPLHLAGGRIFAAKTTT